MNAGSSLWISPGVLALEREYSGLVAQFSRMLRNRILAEDLVNDAVAESLVKLRAQQIENPERLAGFVYRVAINMLKNHRRRVCNRGELHVQSSILDSLPAADDPTECHDRADLVTRVRGVIDELPMARDRALVKRFYLDEEDKTAICADLDLTAAHFDRVIFRARQRLKTLLDRQAEA